MPENRDFLQSEMRRSTTDFLSLARDLNPADFEKNPGGKWSAGQDLHHLVKTLRIVRLGLSTPLFVWRLFYGKANRPSKSCLVFEEQYKVKMSAGIKAPSYVLPKAVFYRDRENLMTRFHTLTEDFCRKLDSFSEGELDGVVVPHPLFGKVTLREMIMAAWMHQDHHTRQLRTKLAGQ